MARESTTHTWDTKVPLNRDYQKVMSLPGIPARGPTAIILSFLSYKHDAIPILQHLSHGSRAYIHNAGGLKGFLIEFNLIDFLKNSEKVSNKWQNVDFRVLRQLLDQEDSVVKKLEFLKGDYPEICIATLEFLGLDEDLKEYI